MYKHILHAYVLPSWFRIKTQIIRIYYVGKNKFINTINNSTVDTL